MGREEERERRSGRGRGGDRGCHKRDFQHGIVLDSLNVV